MEKIITASVKADLDRHILGLFHNRSERALILDVTNAIKRQTVGPIIVVQGRNPRIT